MRRLPAAVHFLELESAVSLASGISPFVLLSIIQESALLCRHLSVYFNEGDQVCNCLLNGLLNSVIARGTSAKITSFFFSAPQIPLHMCFLQHFWKCSLEHSFLFSKGSHSLELF